MCSEKQNVFTEKIICIALSVVSGNLTNQMKISRRKQDTPSMDLRKIILDLKFSIIQDKRVYNNLSLAEKVKLKRFVKIGEK